MCKSQIFSTLDFCCRPLLSAPHPSHYHHPSWLLIWLCVKRVLCQFPAKCCASWLLQRVQCIGLDELQGIVPGLITERSGSLNRVPDAIIKQCWRKYFFDAQADYVCPLLESVLLPSIAEDRSSIDVYTTISHKPRSAWLGSIKQSFLACATLAALS